jgi:hypothetical protein
MKKETIQIGEIAPPKETRQQNDNVCNSNYTVPPYDTVVSMKRMKKIGPGG